jgi:hypothetical protein
MNLIRRQINAELYSFSVRTFWLAADEIAVMISPFFRKSGGNAA